MSDPETFDDWKERTAPSPEAVELANAGSLSTYVAAALITVMLPLGPAAKVALLLPAGEVPDERRPAALAPAGAPAR